MSAQGKDTEPPRLVVSRWISHSSGTSTPRFDIKPVGSSASLGTCGRPGHFTATTPTVYRAKPPREGLPPLRWNLDCPCDAPCPKCGAAVGFGCSTPTGYAAKWHRPRLLASPRCAALLNGTGTYCDLDRHAWVFADTDGRPDPALTDGETAACADCGRIEPIDTSPDAWRRR